MTEIPLYNLAAKWMLSSQIRIGVSFDCPTCRDFPHRIEVPLRDCAEWRASSPRLPIYRYTGERLQDLSVFPTLLGVMAYSECKFKGWIKLGRVCYMDANTKRPSSWLDI